MTLTRKQVIIANDSVRGEFREKVPSLPADVQERFPSLKAHEEATSQWWFQVRQTIQRQYDELKALVEAAEKHVTDATFNVDTNTAAIATFNTQLAALQTQLTNLASALAAIGDPSAGVAVIEAGLAAHIASNTTHGTTGAVVGTTDEQALENKSIGFVAPGYGRFNPLLGGSDVGSGVVVDVPSRYSWIVGDTLTVSGTLNISGVVKVL